MVCADWALLCSEVFSLYRADRLSQLRGDRPPRFDTRGVHPISWCWGQIHAYVNLMPELGWAMFETGDQAFEPRVVRAEAYKQADREYAAEIIRNSKEDA